MHVPDQTRMDVVTAIEISKATLRKMKQNLGWAVGYNTLALPIAAGVLVPVIGLGLRPEIAALTMSASAFRRMTPVVVSSVEPSGVRSVRRVWSTDTRSAPRP